MLMKSVHTYCLDYSFFLYLLDEVDNINHLIQTTVLLNDHKLKHRGDITNLQYKKFLLQDRITNTINSNILLNSTNSYLYNQANFVGNRNMPYFINLGIWRELKKFYPLNETKSLSNIDCDLTIYNNGDFEKNNNGQYNVFFNLSNNSEMELQIDIDSNYNNNKVIVPIGNVVFLDKNINKLKSNHNQRSMLLSYDLPL